MDHDILQIRTFSGGAFDSHDAIKEVDKQVNDYLNYDARLVHSIQPMMVVFAIDGMPWYQYTVMVTLRS